MPNQQRLSKRRPRHPRAAGLPRPPQDPTHGSLIGGVDRGIYSTLAGRVSFFAISSDLTEHEMSIVFCRLARNTTCHPLILKRSPKRLPCIISNRVTPVDPSAPLMPP